MRKRKWRRVLQTRRTMIPSDLFVFYFRFVFLPFSLVVFHLEFGAIIPRIFFFCLMIPNLFFVRIDAGKFTSGFGPPKVVSTDTCDERMLVPWKPNRDYHWDLEKCQFNRPWNPGQC